MESHLRVVEKIFRQPPGWLPSPPNQCKEKMMKKMNVVLMLLVALSFVVPVSYTFAASNSSTNQSQVLHEKININTADEEALSQVPGIGPKTAEKIRMHREENGMFKNIDDLIEVKGIGQKSLEKMKPYITI
jgi:competence protein ComEA